MGKYLEGVNGAITGKVGKVSGSTWKGIPYLKGPYKKRTKSISKDEVANRSRFSVAHYWLKPLLGFVREGFRGYTPTVEGFLAAKSYLMHNAMGEKPHATIDPALVLLSYGDVSMSEDVAVCLNSDDELTFTWSTKSVKNGHARDQAMMVAYDVENNEAFYATLGQFRSAGTDKLEIGRNKGITYHVYFAFCSADRTSQSNSIYLGEVFV